VKRILLPIDFSDNAWNAIFTALKMYSKSACHFILLHTYEPKQANISGFKSSGRAGMVYDALEEESKKELERTLDEIRKFSGGGEFTFTNISKEGDLASVIEKLVPEYDLDMVVMGTKGATGAKQVFMGSNTVKVIKKIRNCPVLAVPQKFNFQTLKKIVFPTEYAHFFSKGELGSLLELAELWQSRILVFHVAQEFQLSEQQMTNKEVLKERLGKFDHTFHKVTISTTVADAITEFALDQKADMIGLVHYTHTFMEKLTQEPVVKRVGFHSKVPLLVLPE